MPGAGNSWWTAFSSGICAVAAEAAKPWLGLPTLAAVAQGLRPSICDKEARKAEEEAAAEAAPCGEPYCGLLLIPAGFPASLFLLCVRLAMSVCAWDHTVLYRRLFKPRCVPRVSKLR